MSDDFMKQAEYCAELGQDVVLGMIAKLLRSRPSLEWINYSGQIRCQEDFREARRLYMQDYRPIRKALNIGRYLLLMAQGRKWEPANMGDALQSAYSGRLNLKRMSDGKIGLTYTAGQYYPTEYRMAIVSVLCQYLGLEFDRVWNTRNWLYGNAVR